MDYKSYLFYQIFRNRPLRNYIFSFQKGRAFKDWVDGNLAAKLGHLYLLQNIPGMEFSTNAIIAAAHNGHLLVVKFLHENKLKELTARLPEQIRDDVLNIIKVEPMNGAAANNHLEIVKYLHDNNYQCSVMAMTLAAINGHLEVVKFLHQNRREGCSNLGLDWAAKNGHLEIVEYLTENGYTCTQNAMDLAAKNGHLLMVKYLHENRQEGCSGNALRFATENNHLLVVKYLQENFTQRSENELPLNYRLNAREDPHNF